MRDYSKIDGYLDELATQIYEQPQDDGHSALAIESISTFLEHTGYIHRVLDVGCGEAFCQDFFPNSQYTGVCLYRDYNIAVAKGRNVFQQDFSFLSFEDNFFDLVYSRHSLEHSPMPLITLMEWRRVTKRYIALVLPNPEYWGYSGKNHYFVLNKAQWRGLFSAVGLEVKYEFDKSKDMTPKQTGDMSEIEYWFLLEKIDEN